MSRGFLPRYFRLPSGFRPHSLPSGRRSCPRFAFATEHFYLGPAEQQRLSLWLSLSSVFGLLQPPAQPRLAAVKQQLMG
jgi:hypothetical protein